MCLVCILCLCWQLPAKGILFLGSPLHLRDFELSLSEFCWLRKMHLFGLKIVVPSDLLLDVVRFTNVLTYLLKLTYFESSLQ